MGERYPLPLDAVLAGSGRGEDYIHQMIVQQVDLIHIEDAAMNPGQESRLDRPPSVPGGLLEVDAAHHPVLGGVER